MQPEEKITDIHRKEEFIRLMAAIAATTDSDMAYIMAFIVSDIENGDLDKEMLKKSIKRAVDTDQGKTLKKGQSHYEELILGAFDILLKGGRTPFEDGVDDLLPRR